MGARKLQPVESAAKARPGPPEDLAEAGEFRADHGFAKWLRDTFIERDAPLANVEHQHLLNASIGVLWTNVANGRHQVAIAATCQLGKPMAMGKWAKAQAEQQRREWFGHVPDFILTFDANIARTLDDISFCAMVEHELLHARYELDDCGGPKFSRATGLPVWAIRGHDVEEFVDVVKRYGPTGRHVAELVEAANRAPSIAPIRVKVACGNCHLKTVT